MKTLEEAYISIYEDNRLAGLKSFVASGSSDYINIIKTAEKLGSYLSRCEGWNVFRNEDENYWLNITSDKPPYNLHHGIGLKKAAQWVASSEKPYIWYLRSFIYSSIDPVTGDSDRLFTIEIKYSKEKGEWVLHKIVPED